MKNMGSLHFLSVGYGDATVIKSNAATFLIDCYGVEKHTYLLPENKKIKAVFITHQHENHYKGSIFLENNGYLIENFIYSPYTRRYADESVSLDEWRDFNSLKNFFQNKGTKLYSPYRQPGFSEPWWESDGIKFEIIGPHSSVADSDTREINDASLVIKAIVGDRKCLFTGDASHSNLKYISENTNDFCNDVLHASHHGSINGAYLNFIKKCNAKYTLISTKSGIFEDVPHSVALKLYKDNTQYDVMRTDLDGTWEWKF